MPKDTNTTAFSPTTTPDASSPSATGPAPRPTTGVGATVRGPASRQTLHPLAVKLLDEATHLSEAERLCLFRSAGVAVGASHPDDEAEAIACVRACQMDLLRQQGIAVTGVDDPLVDDAPMPSRSAVAGWLGAQTPGRYPTLYALTRPFDGRWTDLKAAVTGSPRADFYSRSAPRLGVRTQRAGLVAGIRKWSTDESFDPTLRQTAFLVFARSEMRRAQLDPEVLTTEALEAGDVEAEYAAACNVYIDRFGSWPHALGAAGLLRAMAFEDYLKLMACHKDYSDEDKLDAVRGAWAYAQRLGDERLLNRHYALARRERLRETWSRGEVRFIPCCETVRARFGGPAQALMAAGLGDETELRQSIVDRGVPISPGFARAYVWAAATYLELPQPSALARSKYLALRKRVTLASGEPMPTAKTIVFHLLEEGWSWDAAMLVAETENADPELVERFLARLRETLGDSTDDETVGAAYSSGTPATVIDPGEVSREPMSLAGFDDLFGARRGWAS